MGEAALQKGHNIGDLFLVMDISLCKNNYRDNTV